MGVFQQRQYRRDHGSLASPSRGPRETGFCATRRLAACRPAASDCDGSCSRAACSQFDRLSAPISPTIAATTEPEMRDRPDVALGDELASSALNLAKANPRLRPLHLVVRETEFCGQRLAGDFSRRMRENGRNSVRRPRHASLTDRNCEGFCRPGNRVGLPVLYGGARRNRTDDLFNAMHASLPRSAASRNASVHQENELREVRLGLSNADRLHFSISGRPRCDHISPERRHRRRGCNHISFATGANPSARVRSRRRNVAQSVGSVCG